MGLRCLLGHDFGEPETEREREEKGEEMVVTFRTVKTCSRCGETQVVSENKEVTSIPEAIAGEDTATDDATDEATADTAAGAVASDTPDGSVSTDAVTAADDDGELIDAADEPAADEPAADEPVDDAVATADAADEESTHPRVDDKPEASEEFEPPQSAEEDDGVILDDDAEEEPQSRKPGEWPDSSDVGRGDDDRMPTLEEVEGGAEATDDDEPAEAEPEPEHNPWPDQRGEDEGFAAEVGGSDEDVDVDFGNKLAPELDESERVEEGYDAEFIGNAAESANGAEPGGSAGSPGGITSAETLTREEASEIPTEYYCPECEMTRPADRSSMRAGDICPECHHGYVTERER